MKNRGNLGRSAYMGIPKGAKVLEAPAVIASAAAVRPKLPPTRWREVPSHERDAIARALVRAKEDMKTAPICKAPLNPWVL